MKDSDQQSVGDTDNQASYSTLSNKYLWNWLLILGNWVVTNINMICISIKSQLKWKILLEGRTFPWCVINFVRHINLVLVQYFIKYFVDTTQQATLDVEDHVSYKSEI